VEGKRKRYCIFMGGVLGPGKEKRLLLAQRKRGKGKKEFSAASLGEKKAPTYTEKEGKGRASSGRRKGTLDST